MVFSDLEIAKSYDSGEDEADIVGDFFEPVLSRAKEYYRLAGYFNSHMLAAAARGMASFISRGGTMKLIASPNLSKDDIQVLSSLTETEERATFFAKKLLESINDLSELEKVISKEHAAAMAWMLKNNKLEIRIAVPAPGQTMDALFHHKVGIVLSADSAERLSFSGSINETAAAWTKNFEDFKVFREWETAERDFFDADLQRFDDYWNSTRKNVEVIALPEAVQRKLLSFAPKEFEAIRLKNHSTTPVNDTNSVKLRDYQVEAVSAWRDNGFRGILAMATGTGKTKTAVACVAEILKLHKRLLVVSTSPYQHIATQWFKEFKGYNPVQLAGKNSWRKTLDSAISDLILGVSDVVVLTVVQETASKTSFISQIERVNSVGLPVLFIGDECHGLGARSRRPALNESYLFRLGLSATPARYFDEDGTDFLETYFGGDVYSFPLAKALAWRDPVTGQRALCDYNYFPIFVSLRPEEEEKYQRLSLEVAMAQARYQNSQSVDDDEKLRKLLRDRALILKQAKNKIPRLRELIAGYGLDSNSILYCIDTPQLIAVGEVLNGEGKSWHRFTGEESATGTPSEREKILTHFAEGTYDALIAMKCLDEGVDVPAAQTAYILASSGNPREFIQRRGRILRPDSPEKVAVLYDFVVRRRPFDGMGGDNDKRVFDAEVKRMLEFAGDALNALSARAAILESITGGNK